MERKTKTIQTFNVYRCAIKVDFVGERDREKKRKREKWSVYILLIWKFEFIRIKYLR